MAPLLADPKVSQFPILAIQEHFHNSFTHFIHNPSNTSFHLLPPGVENSRVCFFISKSINPSSWSRDFPSPDYGILRLKSLVERARDIMIHNIYRPIGSGSFISNLSNDSIIPDFFSTPPDTSDVFSLLHHTLLDALVDHILLGDFNNHYPLWGGERATNKTPSGNYISFFNAHFFDLLLHPGTITWFQNCLETTIDLVLASPPLKNALESCRVRMDLHQESDHLPILSVFSFVPPFCAFELCPLWKKANKEAIREKAKEITLFPCNFSSISDVNFSIDLLISWMKRVIAEHVPKLKPVPFCVPWWSEKIGELVEEARRALRHHRRNLSYLSWLQYLDANKAKGTTISKAKRCCFEEAIENASNAQGKSLWRLAKWAKSKSFLPPNSPPCLLLLPLQGPATPPEAKCKAFKARFFPLIPAANLSDIPDFQYPAEKFSSFFISLDEIAAALSKPYSHKAPGRDGLPIYFLELQGPYLSNFSPCSKPACSFHTTPSISSSPPLLF